MSEKDRNEAIDRVIEALKKKEREERRKQQEEVSQQVQQRNGAVGNRNQTPTTTQANDQKGEWYFYNQLAVSQGKATFQKQWGKRENADNWRRMNKTVVSDLFTDDSGQALQDSLAAMQEAKEDSLTAVNDSAQNDPHKREYYLAQIPFTEEQKAESHASIADGLFHSGIIFKDKFDNLRLSEKQFDRLTNSYPDFEKMDEVYYHLFLLHSRKGETAKANNYVSLLSERYPDSQWTTILSDPDYVENSKWGEQIEDSLYAATYEAFKADRFQEVMGNAHISETRFPLGANRDKFVFIRGLSRLNNNDSEGCLEDMNYIVQTFPTSRISEMAGMIVNGVKAGKKLHGGTFDLEDVWSRRAVVLNDSDSIVSRKFVADRNKDFLFIIAYAPDSLNENQLLFEMARFNFTTYIVRNFDIEIEDADGIHLMKFSGFRNFDEAHQYAREVHNQANIVKQIRNARTILISSDNLELLGKQFSYDDYDEFYSKHFAPLKVKTENLLSEPTEMGYEKEPDMKEVLPAGGRENNAEDEGMSIDDDGSGGNVVDDSFDLPDDKPSTPSNDDEGMELPDIPEPTVPTPSPQGTVKPNVPTESPNTDDGEDVVPPTEDTTKNMQQTDDDSYPIDDDLGGVPSGNVIPSVPQETDDINEDVDNNNDNPSNNPEDEYILEVKRQEPTSTRQSTGSELKPMTDKSAILSTTPTQKQVSLPTPTSQDHRKTKTDSSTVVKQDVTRVVKQENNPVVKPRKEAEVEDDIIIFDDEYDIDDTPSKPSPSKKKEKEPDDLYLEDEYYELDGF